MATPMDVDSTVTTTSQAVVDPDRKPRFEVKKVKSSSDATLDTSRSMSGASLMLLDLSGTL